MSQPSEPDFASLQAHIAALPQELYPSIIGALIDMYVASITYNARTVTSRRVDKRAPFPQLYSLALKSSVCAKRIHEHIPHIQQSFRNNHPAKTGRTQWEKEFLAEKSHERGLMKDQWLDKRQIAVRRHDAASVRLDKFVQALRLVHLARVWKARISTVGPRDWFVLKLRLPFWDAAWVDQRAWDEVERGLRDGRAQVLKAWGGLRPLRPKAERVRLGL